MRSKHSLVSTLFAAIFLFAASATPVQAIVLVYKVTYTAKALLFPALHSFKDVGYVIYDTNTPGNSQTVQVFSNKTYAVNGDMLSDIFPSQVAITPADRLPAPAGDTINDTAFALIAFNNGNIFHSRSLLGAISKKPFSIGSTVFTNVSKSLKGKGSLTNATFDHFTVTESWVLDLPVTGANPTTTDVARDAVISRLELQGFNQVT
jgi:hypothetical protein